MILTNLVTPEVAAFKGVINATILWPYTIVIFKGKFPGPIQ